MSPFPLILSSPSGGGKTTIARMLLARRRDVGYSISCTTRAPRAGERDGESYHFLSRDDFVARRAAGEFAESAEVHGNLYGTLKSEVARVLEAGKHVVMDIDVQGAAQFARAYPDSVLIFLLPPSAVVLLDRLDGRNSEAPEARQRRLRSALSELEAVEAYEYVVVNDDLEHAYRHVSAVIDAEAVRRHRSPQVHELIGALDAELRRHIHAQPAL